jgi:tetratricopeptide (TPR) repeat protein
VGRDAEIWRTDPVTLRDVPVNRAALESELEGCPALERVWILSLLGRDEEAVAEGRVLLADSQDRFRPLLVLAHAYQRQYRWYKAAKLQEEALRLADTPVREALVRHQIGRRLFDEARYRDAAAEFEWAYDLYRTSGRAEVGKASRQAMERAREIYRAQRQGQVQN